MAVSRLSLTNSLTLGAIQPAITYPVQPVKKVTDVLSAGTTNVVDNASTDYVKDKASEFSAYDKLSYNENNPYDAGRKSMEYSIVSGMNFDEMI